MAKCERLEHYLVTVTQAEVNKVAEANVEWSGGSYAHDACGAVLKQNGLWERFVTWGADDVDTEEDDRRCVALLRAARGDAGG